MKTRITQTDIARIAGVHNTTVSLCLRNSPSIPVATRERIRLIAEELGYYPDPALRALVAYRNQLSPSRPRDTLAFVTQWDSCWGWREWTNLEQAYVGAQRKAAELGYQLEHFWLGEAGMTQRRLGQVLFHRGIPGVLLAAQPPTADALTDLDWSRLCAVRLGAFPSAPAFHRVSEDYCGLIRLGLRRLRAAGFFRIGLVLSPWWDDFAHQGWSAGYLTEQNDLPSYQRVPMLRLPGDSRPNAAGERRQADALAAWYREHRPDAIIGYSPTLLTQLRGLGLRVPQDVAYVDLGLAPCDADMAALRPDSESVGEIATAMLDAQIQQHARGVPRVATTTLIGGRWIAGATCPVAPTSADFGGTEVEEALARRPVAV